MSERNAKAPPQGGGQGGSSQKGDGPKPKPRRTVTFTFTMPTLISLSIGAIFACVWIFVMGVVLGRGYYPEERIPKLNELMPQTTPEAPQLLASDVPGTRNGTPSSVSNSEPRVISSQDLSYPVQLKAKPEVEQVKTAVKKAPVKPVAVKAEPAKNTASKTQAALPEAAKPLKRQDTIAGKETNSAAPEGVKEVFDYEFQVAAFKEAGPANTLHQKLKGSGLQAKVATSVEKGVTWYRNMVNFRGTADDVDVLRQRLAQHNLKTLIRKSKTPVGKRK